MTVQKACKMLMIKEPFYGLFLSTLNKIFSKNLKTLGVGLQGINQVLYINEDFWNSLTDNQQLAVLKHELMHICFFHLTMRNDFANHELFNIAADLEINQYIENLPEGCVNLLSIQSEVDANALTLGIPSTRLEPKAGAKEYYKILEKYQIKNDSSEKGDHSQWKDFDDMTDAEKKLVENQIDYNLKNTTTATKKLQGNIPGELLEKINSLFEIKPQIFNWKAYLRRVLGTATNYYTKKSLRKLSKRFDDSAGIKIKPKSRILVAIDTSGSLSKQELEDFFSEISHIYKAGASIKIIECDVKIQKEYEYKGKFDYEVKGRGGTDFAPVINYYNERRSEFTTLVFFTDGYASLNNFKLMKKMIWVISSSGAQNETYPGLTIKIPKQCN